MPSDEKESECKIGDVGPTGKTADGKEAFGEALSKAGFEPAKVSRKVVPQGRRRELVKRPCAKNLG